MDTEHSSTITFKVERDIRKILYSLAKEDCVSVSECLRIMIYRDGLRAGNKVAFEMKARRDAMRAGEDRLVSSGRVDG